MVMTKAGDVAAGMAAIADEVAGPAAADVDERGAVPLRDGRRRLKAEGLLAALVPLEFGGGGATLAEVSQGLVALGRRCASSAMVVAMHHIQVACLVRHGRNEVLQRVPGGAGRAPVPAGFGHDRGGHGRRRPVQHLRPRGELTAASGWRSRHR